MLDMATSLAGIQVLVVDDDVDTVEFLSFLLEEYGVTVQKAFSAIEALGILEQEQPDVLVSDIGMPEMDGYALLEKIRSKPPEQGGNLPAIALTAYSGDFCRQQVLNAGFQHHLPKPVEPTEFIAIITKLFSDYKNKILNSPSSF